MNPKYVLVSPASFPRVGIFVYGLVGQHEELVRSYELANGYCKVHGGGWYEKDDKARTMVLYGSSGDYGEPRLTFLNRIPAELRDYTFYFRPGWNLPANPLDLQDVEWI